MRKNKKRTKTSNSNGQTIKAEIDYEKLAHAIIKSQKAIKEEEIRQQELQHHEWLASMGYKKYDSVPKTFLTGLKSRFNMVYFFFRVLFIRKSKVPRKIGTYAVMSLLVQGLFALLKYSSYVISLYFVINFVRNLSKDILFLSSLSYLPWAAAFFILARYFRIAEIEVEKMDIRDRDYLSGLLSGITSFIALIISIIALIVNI